MKLQNKTAIVTGAASGMGKAIAIEYAKEGANVIVSDLNLEGANVVAEEIITAGGVAAAIKTNVANLDELQAMYDFAVEKFGSVDIVMNNAGIMDGMQPVNEVEDDRWDLVMNVNTKAVMQSMRIATNIFLEQGHGVIVNNISAGGLYGARAGAVYTASKHAVVGLTKNTAFMYADKNIRCNGIAPGGVATNIGASMSNMSEVGYKRQSLGMAINPRTGEPIEIAKLAVFLASDDSSFINGQVVGADAGWSAY
ncbi:SDR family oxidoreductase [Kurthia sibirica]|uniref:3-ketoacyl-ACP reductase n=1 Tax=Kurthia sibirica TaxID=202750 RepID=A0A2U3AP31_9BACL|nr:SDR family oxidoreductase [Kurthia sibirica]PWI26294.1 3-ketoacyl-ACP reductase [Kurthia sibirica]GEK35426.1 3-ketoacyl-ACP reductase [Kurthia sibirica]